jgi:hypothetical protein
VSAIAEGVVEPWHCPLYPNSGHCRLLDHIVCTGEKRWRNGKTNRLGCLEINCQLELGGRLHRQVARLLALEDVIDIAGRLTKLVDEVFRSS